MKRFLTLSLALLAGLTLLALPVLAQGGGKGGGKAGHFERLKETLGLSAQQEDQIKSLFSQHRDQMQAQRQAFEASLTADQKAKLEAFKSEHRGHKRGERGQRPEFLAGLNLTPEQQTLLDRVKADRRSLHGQIEAVLTPEQRQKMEQLRIQKRPPRS
ncbi:MAG: hypothetical protein HY319_23615 [Armatimonadetes bacterium]|nr:hypothetical protein [Armatimonadota bacterium]